MRKRIKVAFVVVLLGIVGLILWELLRAREPVYDGKPVSYWTNRDGQNRGGDTVLRVRFNLLVPKPLAGHSCRMSQSLSQSMRLKRAESGLIVVDIQERLLPAIFEKERVTQNAVRLAKGAAILGIPAVVTEQYVKGLGATVAEVAAAIDRFAPIEKLAFSACGAPGFLAALRDQQISSALLCGIEAHVCVTQTCLDLLEQGIQVFVAADAISSRTPENYRLGLDRMRHAGAVIVSTEMALFEWLGQAGTEEFRQILPLVR